LIWLWTVILLISASVSHWHLAHGFFFFSWDLKLQPGWFQILELKWFSASAPPFWAWQFMQFLSPFYYGIFLIMNHIDSVSSCQLFVVVALFTSS
jgi:hypothetical protein